jgi:hypothetical protein
MAKPSLVAAFRAALPPELREKARIDLPSAAELKAAIGNLAAKLRQQIRVKFQGFPCLLAVDGGTLHRITLLNFVVLPMCSSRVAPLFVCSRRVDDCTSRTITKEVLEVKKYVQTMFGMFPVGCVSDNASAMARALADAADDGDEEGEAGEEKKREKAEANLFSTDLEEQGGDMEEEIREKKKRRSSLFIFVAGPTSFSF